MQTTQLGDRGEQAVSEELVRLGYEIVDRNWKTKWCEIDIVAQKNNTTYFIEVKYRRSDTQGDGFDYITDQKLHHMQRAAELWVTTYTWHGPYELLGASVIGELLEIDIREIA